MASIRLRCLVPMAALRQVGLPCEPYAERRHGSYRAVVFSKTYDDRALAVANSLKANGTRVILDLCDNHFFGEETDRFTRERTARLARMISAADLVVSSTSMLREQLRARFALADGKVMVIPDYLEDQAPGVPSMADRFAIWRLDQFFRRHLGSLRLIWFGNHGAGSAPAGMADLARIRPVIEAQATTTGLTLTVMSNSYLKYRRLIADWSVPTTYVAWTEGRAEAVLRRHQVAVLPINRNPFTLAKTINRPATAILAGLGVIADAIPSYEELRPFIELDDWPEGLRRYAGTAPAHDPRLVAAQAHMAKAYDAAAITALWRAALRS